MVDIIPNLGDVIGADNVILQGLPPEIVSNLGNLIMILKAAGIIFICYLAFLIIMSILNIRKSIRIKKIYEKVNEIDVKLDRLLKNHKNPVKKEKIKEKKKK